MDYNVGFSQNESQYATHIFFLPIHTFKVLLTEYSINWPIYIHLKKEEDIDLSGIILDDWSCIRIPNHIKTLNLSNTNFNQNLSHITTLQYLNICKVNNEDWSNFRIPVTLKALDMYECNYKLRFSHMDKCHIEGQPCRCIIC